MVYKGSSSFRVRVELLVAQIPTGRVMTYGQIAVLCGSPRAARIVGGIAHYGDLSLPWHRVVNKKGGLARGYPGGMSAHAQHLREEGVHISEDYRVSIEEYLWSPLGGSLGINATNRKSLTRTVDER